MMCTYEIHTTLSSQLLVANAMYRFLGEVLDYFNLFVLLDIWLPNVSYFDE